MGVYDSYSGDSEDSPLGSDVVVGYKYDNNQRKELHLSSG
jgi:hypothetical protein